MVCPEFVKCIRNVRHIWYYVAGIHGVYLWTERNLLPLVMAILQPDLHDGIPVRLVEKVQCYDWC